MTDDPVEQRLARLERLMGLVFNPSTEQVYNDDFPQLQQQFRDGVVSLHGAIVSEVKASPTLEQRVEALERRPQFTGRRAGIRA